MYNFSCLRNLYRKLKLNSYSNNYMRFIDPENNNIYSYVALNMNKE